jgi:putative ABC transport system permease protein
VGYFALLRANLFRNKRRTILTFLSVAVALFLFVTLRTVITSFQAAVDFADVNRLVVRHASGIIFDLPIAYRDRIATVDGVTGISWANWFGGVYVDERNFFARFAVDADSYFELYPEYVLESGQLEAFRREKTACIVGEGIANQFGWKVGDRIVLKGTIYPGDWEFVIRGIYAGADDTTDERQMFFRWDYLDENNFAGRGRAGIYIVQVRDADVVPMVSQRLDALFANSANETRTETEAMFQLGFVSMVGNVQFAVNLIGAAVVIAIILVAMNTMMMAARERLPEFAIMKILGFPDWMVVGLMVGEAVAVSAVGGLAGIFGARILFDVTDFTAGGFFPSFLVRGDTILLGIGVALLLGLVAALYPAWQAGRLREVEALRHLS